MQLKPLSDHVVVKPQAKTETTKSGIVIPDTAEKEQPRVGEVLAIGPGKFLENGTRAPMSVKPGDKVLYTKRWDKPEKLDGVEYEYLVLEESEIIAIIED